MENTTKKVLIPAASRSIPGYSDTRGAFALETYLKKISDLGLIPILVPANLPRKMIDQLYRLSSGVHFIGGSDLEPGLYREKKHPQTAVNEPDRDMVETYILKKVLRDRKPFFGICRGMQSLVVATGGSLCQHLPDIVKTEIHHIDTRAGKKYEDIQKNRHKIVLHPDSRLFDMLKKKTFSVNSAHHQAAKKIGKDLVAAAHSPAGVIEAVEHRDGKIFCIGVQCHPELENRHPLDILYQNFGQAVKNFQI